MSWLRALLLYHLISANAQPAVLSSLTLFPLSPPVPATASAIVASLLTSLRESLRHLADPEGRVTIDGGLTATSLTHARKSANEPTESYDSKGTTSLGKQLGAKDKERELDRLRHVAEVEKLNREIEKLRSELGLLILS